MLLRSGQRQLRRQGIPRIRQLRHSSGRRQRRLQHLLHNLERRRLVKAPVPVAFRLDPARCLHGRPAGSRQPANGLPCVLASLFRAVRAHRKACDRRQLLDNIRDNSGPAVPRAQDRRLQEDIRSVPARDVQGKVRVDRVREGHVLAGPGA